jgi:hypothetical protein
LRLASSLISLAMPHVLENEEAIMFASSLSASPALAIEYVSAPVRKETEKCCALSFANHSSFFAAGGDAVF